MTFLNRPINAWFFDRENLPGRHQPVARSFFSSCGPSRAIHTPALLFMRIAKTPMRLNSRRPKIRQFLELRVGFSRKPTMKVVPHEKIRDSGPQLF